VFIGVTVHWVVDGHMQSIILDFIKWVTKISSSGIRANDHMPRASKGHTGTYLASWVLENLHEYGIHGKVSRSAIDATTWSLTINIRFSRWQLIMRPTTTHSLTTFLNYSRAFRVLQLIFSVSPMFLILSLRYLSPVSKDLWPLNYSLGSSFTV